MYEYNQVSNEWRVIPQSNTFTKSFAKTPAIKDSIQDIVYIYGVATDYHMYVYNLMTNSWNFSTAVAPYHLDLYSAVELNGEILYIGGVDQPMDKVIIPL